MRNALKNSYSNSNNSTEWLLLKVSLCILWLDVIGHVALNTEGVLYPSGLCAFFDCNFFVIPQLALLVFVLAIVLMLFYLFERWMVVTTFLMFLLSLLVFTLEESNGILMRCGLYTMVFFAQFVAYLRNTDELESERIQFAVQIIAAGYFLAGVSKLRQSGLAWVNDAPQASIQIIKNYCSYYFNSGEAAQLQKGVVLSGFVLRHALFVKILFGFSLVLELFAWVSLKSKKHALVYGFLLLMMHIGIYYFMNILVVAVFYPMVVFLLNPFYLLYRFGAMLLRPIVTSQ